LQPIEFRPRIAHKSVVVIFVRHRPQCQKAHFGPYHRGCDCPKFYRYSRAGRQRRVSAKTRSWSTAEGNARELEDRLNGQAATHTDSPKDSRSTIAQAVETFIRRKESESIGASTIRKLRYQLNLFESFMSSGSKFFPADITPHDVVDFRASWKRWGDLTRIKAQQNLRGFLRFACDVNRQTLLDALGTIKQTRDGRERRKPKPLSETELGKLLAQVPKTFASEPHKIPVVTAFIKCAVSTGFACTDVVHLERRTLESATGGILEIERVKTGRKATPRIDTALRQELLGVMNGNPRYVFWNGESLPGSATGLWQTDLRQLFQDAGLWIKGNLSHRFRDTAVDFWLAEGCSMTDVAAMLGDTVTVVEKHYADLASKRMAERLAKLPARQWVSTAPD
jgi:integrase